MYQFKSPQITHTDLSKPFVENIKDDFEFSFGDFDNLPEITRKNYLDKLKLMRHCLSLEKQGKIDKFIREINEEYVPLEKNMDISIKKIESEMFLEEYRKKNS